jgi:hypothetical protein
MVQPLEATLLPWNYTRVARSSIYCQLIVTRSIRHTGLRQSGETGRRKLAIMNRLNIMESFLSNFSIPATTTSGYARLPPRGDRMRAVHLLNRELHQHPRWNEERITGGGYRWGKDLWVTESAFGGILKAPVNNPTAALRSVYLDPGGTSKVSGMKFLHGTGKGGTMTMPYGIGVDATGNVWATNAGCTVNACTPSRSRRRFRTEPTSWARSQPTSCAATQSPAVHPLIGFIGVTISR